MVPHHKSIIRYSTGSTDLICVESIGSDYIFGRHCMGGTYMVYRWDAASKQDLKKWESCAHWRNEDLWPDHKPLICVRDHKWTVIDRTPIGRYRDLLQARSQFLIAHAEKVVARLNTQLKLEDFQ